MGQTWIHPGLETGPPRARLGSFWILRRSLRGPPWFNLGTKLDQTWFRATGITPMTWDTFLNWAALPIWGPKGTHPVCWIHVESIEGKNNKVFSRGQVLGPIGPDCDLLELGNSPRNLIVDLR